MRGFVEFLEREEFFGNDRGEDEYQRMVEREADRADYEYQQYKDRKLEEEFARLHGL